MARFFPDLRSLFGEDELYKIFNVSVLSTPWEGATVYVHSSSRQQTTNVLSIPYGRALMIDLRLSVCLSVCQEILLPNCSGNSKKYVSNRK